MASALKSRGIEAPVGDSCLAPRTRAAAWTFTARRTERGMLLGYNRALSAES